MQLPVGSRNEEGEGAAVGRSSGKSSRGEVGGADTAESDRKSRLEAAVTITSHVELP